MFRHRQSRTDRVRHEALQLASRGLARGRHSAEALREALPEAGDVLAELRHQAEPVLAATREQAEPALKAAREQAEPVLKAAREQAEPALKAAREQVEKAPVQRKRSRSKKPFVLLALVVVGAVIAYLLLAKRDQDPAYLMQEPDAPDESPAVPPTPDASVNGSSSSDDPSVSTPTGSTEDPATEDVDVPERVSAFMAGEPAQPSPTSSPGLTSTPSNGTPRASADAPRSGTASASYAPGAQVAAWDLPSSSIPPMRGQTSL